MKRLSKIQKLIAVMIIFVFGLVFYALGIATDFFASPLFSAFFVVSYQTAHNFVTYIAISSAVVLSVVGLSLVIIERRKTETQEIGTEPVVVPLSNVIIKEASPIAFLSADEFENEEIGSGCWETLNGISSSQEIQQPNTYSEYKEQSAGLTISEEKTGAQESNDTSANKKSANFPSSATLFSELPRPFLEVKPQAVVQNKLKTKRSSMNIERKKTTALPKKRRSKKSHSKKVS